MSSAKISASNGAPATPSTACSSSRSSSSSSSASRSIPPPTPPPPARSPAASSGSPSSSPPSPRSTNPGLASSATRSSRHTAWLPRPRQPCSSAKPSPTCSSSSSSKPSSPPSSSSSSIFTPQETSGYLPPSSHWAPGLLSSTDPSSPLLPSAPATANYSSRCFCYPSRCRLSYRWCKLPPASSPATSIPSRSASGSSSSPATTSSSPLSAFSSSKPS